MRAIAYNNMGVNKIKIKPNLKRTTLGILSKCAPSKKGMTGKSASGSNKKMINSRA